MSVAMPALTPDQVLLLQASLGTRAQAIPAWERWRESVDVDLLDPDSNGLLPQLYRNLRALEVRDPLLARLKGVYRHTWSANAVLLSASRSALEALGRAGLAIVVMDAAGWRHYGELGARSIDHLDLLVRPTDLASAARILRDGGWSALRPVPEDPVLVPECFTPFAAGEQRLYLHWRILAECCPPGAAAEAVRRSAPVELGGAGARVLDPADELFRVAIRASQADGSRARLLADATMLIRSAGPSLDWDHLLVQARRYRLVLALAMSLHWLSEALKVPVSAEVLAALGTARFTARERLELRLRSGRLRLGGRLPNLAFHYLRLREELPGLPLAGFAGYLQSIWGLDRRWEVPVYALRRGMQRVRSSASSARITY